VVISTRAMKTTLDHLPPRKQDELRAVVDVLRAGVPMSMLILFGSHARGDWVEDPDEGYFSDYDLLAIVQSPKVVDDAARWSHLEDEANALTGEAALSLLVHDIRFVNSEIRAGSYFFGDIRNEGIVLHDARRFALATPRRRTRESAWSGRSATSPSGSRAPLASSWGVSSTRGRSSTTMRCSSSTRPRSAST